MPIRHQIKITDREEIFTDNSESDLENLEDEELSPVMDHLFLVSYNNKKGIDVQNCIWHGIDCVDFGHFDEAILNFDKGLESDPDITDFWLFKVFCYKKMNSPIDTIEYLEKINWDMYFIHIQRLYQKCQFKKALKYCDIGIEVNPSDPDLWDNKGSCLEQLGKPDEARNCYDHAKKIDRIVTGLV